MPELPEVETIKRVLESKLTGSTLKKIDILTPKSFHGNHADLIGQKITGFTRLGKQLSIHLSNHKILLVHLKMTGQLILVGHQKTVLGHPTKDMFTQSLPNKSTRLVFYFNHHSKLFFNDQRKFGWVKVLTPSELAEAQSEIGIDILDPRFTFNYFFTEIQKTKRPIKLTILNQDKFAGIGNIYANDALFLAKIHPLTPSSQIRRPRAKKLHQSIISVINESISRGGSTIKDNKYLRPDGSFGGHQYHLRVYQRAGEPCLRCQNTIQRLKVGGRSTFFCPVCQPLPR